eukprot:XP_001710150.1 Hypothetical protein GL50803_113757 [Giardia lamblia ATCC 50803]
MLRRIHICPSNITIDKKRVFDELILLLINLAQKSGVRYILDTIYQNAGVIIAPIET